MVMDMGKLVVTSIKVDEELWKEAKIEAIKRGVTLTEFLNEAVKKELRITDMQSKGDTS